MNAPILGATTILAPLQILNNPDLAVTDMQHVKGGGWSLPDLTQRDLIPAGLRQANITKCFVVSEDKTYVLKGGIANSDWTIDTATAQQGGSTGSKKLLNRFLSQLQLRVGQAFTLDLPDNLFGPAPVAYTSLEIQGLPDGLAHESPVRITGTPTALGFGIVLINATLTTGEKLQYALAYKTADAANVVNTVGVVAIDVSFGAMNPLDLTQLVYDFDLALQLNEPGLTENAQRAVPGVSGRFIGDQSVTNCIAVAAIAKQTVPGNAPIRFYRFGISLARLRALYPNRSQVQFDLRGKRKGANPAGLGNAVTFRVGRDLSSGLLSAAQPIGFASANPTAAGQPDDYTNSGTGFGVNDTETVLGKFIVQPGDGLVIFIPVAVAPVAPAQLSTPTMLITSLQDGFKVTYNQVDNATGYEVQYSDDADAEGNSAVVSGLERTVGGLTANTTYYARVRALGANGASSPWGYILSATPGGQVTVLDSIGTVQAWLRRVAYSRDAASLDTSIWLTGASGSQRFEVALRRKDNQGASGLNWQTGQYGLATLASSLTYPIDPYTSVSRFNKGSGSSGVTSGEYEVLVRRPETPLAVFVVDVTFGASTGGAPVVLDEYVPPVVATTGTGGGSGAGNGNGSVVPLTVNVSTDTPDWLEYLGWNRDVTTGETNLFWDSTEPLKARILENGLPVANASWPTPFLFMGKFTGDAFVPGDHDARVRLVTGILAGHTYTVELQREATPAPVFATLWTPIQEAGIHEFSLPVEQTATGIGSGGGSGNATNTLESWAGSYVYGAMRLLYLNDPGRMDLELVDNTDGTYSVIDHAPQEANTCYKLDYAGNDMSIVTLSGRKFPKNQAMLIQKYKYDTGLPVYEQLARCIWGEVNMVIF